MIYDSDKVLKIGDAPSDYRAAWENGILFYPIVPGRETESWRHVEKEASDRFDSKTPTTGISPVH